MDGRCTFCNDMFYIDELIQIIPRSWGLTSYIMCTSCIKCANVIKLAYPSYIQCEIDPKSNLHT